jgi:protein-L-isoaspartate(D-aspartate) O-methyltransferase
VKNSATSGIGMTSQRTRTRMVERLRQHEIRDERVLSAMGTVPRHLFVEEALASRAYEDTALPIGFAQTISQPYVVARMIEALIRDVKAPASVLEVGTGCGYQAAILAELAAAVFSIERHAELAQQAAARLRELGYQNIFVRTGDGSLGWPEEAPFDRIIVTAAAEECPTALWQQLREGGVLVGPFGPPYEQALYAMHKIGGKPQSRILTGCRFVPLVTENQ